MARPVLEVADVHTYYGDSYVLQGVSLTVPAGQVVALLGRNGAGKSTLIRSIVGFTPARRGTIRFKDQDITRLPPHAVVRRGIALVPQGRRVFPSLTVGEHLSVAARHRPGGEWTVERVLALFPRLGERLRNRGNELSGGEQQMLASGRALVSNPELVLMDEPSEGLAPLLMRELTGTIQELKAKGIAILLVEQRLSFALELADHVYIMSNGRIVHSAPPHDVASDAEIKARHLGV